MLIGAAAERFVAPDVEDEAKEIEHELAEADEYVLRELRAIRAQLDGLEAALRTRR